MAPPVPAPDPRCRAAEERLWSLARPSPPGSRPTLERMRRLLARLGDPQRHLRAVHIGGTSGKGSTCHLLAAILQAAGYRAGLHSKPHLQSVRERLVVDGRPIDCVELAALVEAVAPDIAVLTAEGTPPTWFEVVVALAFTWFRQRRADPAVVEVGLGGTWDGTNVLLPLLSVLTNVGLDHTELLGDTVEQIAADKAGIFKPGTLAITGASQPSVLALLAERASAVGSPLWRLGREIALEVREVGATGSLFDLALPGARFRDLRVGLLGRHQVDNAALAVSAAVALRTHGYRIEEGAIREGLTACRVPGRLELLPGEPPFLLDGAHSPPKMAALAAALTELFPASRPVCLVAMRRGHDPADTRAPRLDVAGALVSTRFGAATDWGAEQSIDPDLLRAQAAGRTAAPLLVEPEAGQALDVARSLAGPRGLVCATGSLYLVGELRGLLHPGISATLP